MISSVALRSGEPEPVPISDPPCLGDEADDAGLVVEDQVTDGEEVLAALNRRLAPSLPRRQDADSCPALLPHSRSPSASR